MSSDPDLFADLLEYREVFAALAEFGSGYNVAVERRWALLGDSHFVVTITKRAPMEKDQYPEASWHAHGSDAGLVVAVREAIQHARAQEASGGKALGRLVPTVQGVAPGTLVGLGVWRKPGSSVKVVPPDLTGGPTPSRAGP